MNLLAELQRRFAAALPAELGRRPEILDSVRPSQNPKFGDYQADFAMKLAKELKQPPQQIAQDVAARLAVADVCEPPAIAGAGFINLRIKDSWLAEQLRRMVPDPRLGIPPAQLPRTFVIDYSAPNVAKPMHVGHIRSTVIGDALARTLRFVGHRVIGDNHIGDWGTQFGMLIFGYKHLLDPQAYRQDPVGELARLYRQVNKLLEYEAAVIAQRNWRQDEQQHLEAIATARAQVAAASSDQDSRRAAKELRRRQAAYEEALDAAAQRQALIQAVESDRQLKSLFDRFQAQGPPGKEVADPIGRSVLAETAGLHAGDPENRRLWHEFLPPCLAQLDAIYQRLGVKFDHTLGESFYHDQLAEVVEDLLARGIARVSDGAVCIFREGHDAPLVIRKKDGAFLYGTSDLATIRYRMHSWQPDAILYVVDHRQSLHFEALFDAARRWGFTHVELVHVSFGTVLGEDGRPFKTRSGGTVGLEGLLDEAVERALRVLQENPESRGVRELSPGQQRRIAEIVGLGALKYADLSHNRTSDYEFSYDKMLAMNGNTATYMQYAYARVQSVFRKGNVDLEALRRQAAELQLTHPHERALALELLRFEEALAKVIADYRPNQLTSYLFDQLASAFSTFYESCPVLTAESLALRASRLLLCDLTARTLKLGLELLGIQVVEKM
jgi:arginyl-tRNA synthetase